MKFINWYLLMYLFTYYFYNFYLDYIKVVTMQCLDKGNYIYMVTTVLCYLGICMPSCHGTAKPCCLWILQYCCLGMFQSGYLGIFQLNCLGTYQPSSQEENVQLGCPIEGLSSFAAQNEDFLAWLPSMRSFQLCCLRRGLFSLASLMWTFPAWVSQKRTLQLCKTCPEKHAKLRNTTFLLLGLLQLDLPAS
jgi:hypothetical protein